ncbi:alcohol dehydrogenase-like 7 isoform X1 [Cucurbita moschata]|uniref:Alcohol dehydrogenase-like 7 isoform X1 n=1 Tax=Cucurbita moschata TaxID=3662 RepID=A0A6J1G466_CUCMO|nr:alcohol dehydrogenase-like 7 isoform X1 [Cucurbita moschata]
MEHKSSMANGGKPIRCRAAVCQKAGEALVMEEILVAPPMAYEVRIRIICTSLCHTDVKYWKMKDPPGIVPRILGHEAVGEVESVGDQVSEVKQGDIVIPTFLAECGECRDCTSNKSNICSEHPYKLSQGMPRCGTSRFTDLSGEVLHHFMFVSSFSEYTVVDVTHLIKLDPILISPDKACLLGCGVSTGVGAAWRTANLEKGSTVAIFGLGTVGLAVAQGARICGAERIIGIDINPDKLTMAKKCGVTEFVNSRSIGDKSVSQVIIEMTDGGADYCFECVGLSSLIKEAFACCRKGRGKTILFGVEDSVSVLGLKSIDVISQGKTVIGCIYGGLKPKSDIPTLIQWYLDKEVALVERLEAATQSSKNLAAAPLLSPLMSLLSLLIEVPCVGNQLKAPRLFPLPPSTTFTRLISVSTLVGYRARSSGGFIRLP